MLAKLLSLLKLWIDRRAWQHDLSEERSKFIQSIKEKK